MCLDDAEAQPARTLPDRSGLVGRVDLGGEAGAVPRCRHDEEAEVGDARRQRSVATDTSPITLPESRSRISHVRSAVYGMSADGLKSNPCNAASGPGARPCVIW
jgi:hypothetical protein